MVKVTQSICLDYEQVELLSDVKVKYHLKNNSQAVSLIIRQWQMFLEDKIRQKMAEQTKKKPINPMVNP
jgi:hypothetical protein